MIDYSYIYILIPNIMNNITIDVTNYSSNATISVHYWEWQYERFTLYTDFLNSDGDITKEEAMDWADTISNDIQEFLSSEWLILSPSEIEYIIDNCRDAIRHSSSYANLE
jgi:hypothetical protein